ncbi:beta-3 adrenergic receptor-like [Patiria miniata]|uniref:G-protein coupled receptors family 1 profile domain-containing protein n=1 Tax=Patiria miniata TaxID=46514 RepID=A0A914BAJ8_PATMI|nr:beta-3 adrenergic receptor-like [Patiria miniata]
MSSTPNVTDLGDYNFSSTPASTDGVADSLRIVQCILLVTTIFLLTLNPLCLLVLRRVDSIQDTTKVFLRALIAANLGVGIFLALPMTFAAFNEDWPFGDTLCGLQAFLLSTIIYSPPASLLMLTVDRYISVVHALRYPSLVTVNRTRIAVMSVLGALLLIGIGYNFVGEWHFVYRHTFLFCVCTNDKAGNLTLPFIQVTFSCIVSFALLTILITYIRLFLISRHHERRIHANNPAALEGNPLPRPGTKTLHTLLIIVLSAFIFNLLPLLWIVLGDVNMDPLVNFFMFDLPVLTNSWLNVVIYFFRNKDVRQATRNLLRTYFTLLQQHFPFTCTCDTS